MSVHPPNDPSFTPNPDINLNLNAAAAAYAVDQEWNGRVQGLLADERPLAEGFFGDLGPSERSEIRRGFRDWQGFLRKKEIRKGE